MDVAYLGVVSVDTQSVLNARVAQLEDLHIQAFTDLSILLDQGHDTSGYKAELDNLGNQISVLKSDIYQLDGSEQSLQGWNERADALEAQLKDVLSRTEQERRGAGELTQLQGLGWMLALGLTATALGSYVWLHRRKGRRR